MSSFDPYVVLLQVAEGATGTVYKARHAELDRLVAIKALSPAVRAVPGLLERFRSEARLLTELDDPHVVALFDYVEDDGRAWLVQEWVEGASLTAVLAQHGRLSAEQSLGVLRGGLLGLAHAHDRGVVHRDVAPGNVLLDMAGVSKLVDFGLAAPVGQTGVCGTPAFVSPEAAVGAAMGPAADVYSSAAVLFMLLTGQPPFPASDPAAVLRRHRTDPAPQLTGHGEQLADLLRRAMAKDPVDRPPHARAFLDELEQAATERYGAAWLSRASVAALVSSTVAAGGTAAVSGAAGGGAVATTAVAAPTVLISTGHADTGTEPLALAVPEPAASPAPSATSRRSPAARLRHLKALPIALAGAMLLVGIATVSAVALTRDDDDASADRPDALADAVISPSPDISDEASPSASPSSAPTAAQAELINGQYDLNSELLSTTFPDDESVGTKELRTWDIQMSCSQGVCTGPITSSSGRVFQATFDGTTLSYTVTEEATAPCLDSLSGQDLPGTSATETLTNAVRLVLGEQDEQGRTTRLSGSSQQDQVLAQLVGDCSYSGPYTSERSYTLTRR